MILAIALMALAASAVKPGECRTNQPKSPPYVLTVTCKEDCAHPPKHLTVADIMKSGTDRRSAEAIINWRNRYWMRSCGRTP